MDQPISCPACNAAITASQLFRTATLLRFKCPHCAARLQPKDKSFVTGWLVVGAVVGLVAGVAAAMLSGVVRDPMQRSLAYIGLVLLVAGAVAIIKWRASLALIKKGELRVVR
jgi:hypothetical protein